MSTQNVYSAKKYQPTWEDIQRQADTLRIIREDSFVVIAIKQR